ncbi:hypothetical protein LSAT2_032550 [Lamellibrachia satsuma]|nr:hypothetical protein LSAT2_032550 [Lamellibrachia satsuma]
MARPSTRIAHIVEADCDVPPLQNPHQAGKGAKRKGKLKRSDGSFSDSSNSFIRQRWLSVTVKIEHVL